MDALRATPAKVCLVAVLAATAFPLSAVAEPTAPVDRCPSRVTERANGWQRISAPPFSAGPAKLTAYAVAPEDSATLLATNGVAVSRSVDGGCTWTEQFVLPAAPTAEMPTTRENAVVVEIVVAKERSYLLLSDQLGPRVVVSDDGGDSWQLTATPTVGSRQVSAPPDIVADASGMTAYVVARAAPRLGLVSAGTTLLVTEDGGGTWTTRPVDLTGGTGVLAQVNDIAVDPLAPDDVWVASSVGLFHSEDAGRAWVRESPRDGDSFGLVTVTHRSGDAVQVLVASAVEPLAYVSKSGDDWLTVNTPGMATSLAGGRTTDQAAMTAAGGVHELKARTLTWGRTHGGRPALTQLSTDHSARPSFFACECESPESAIWTRVAPRPTEGILRPDRGSPPQGPMFPGFDGCADDPPAGRHDPAAFAESAVHTDTPEIEITPDRPVTMPYTFTVQPRPLEVYFLLGSGPRSLRFGCAAAHGAVWAASELGRVRNLRVGVGEYRDYPGAVNTWYFVTDCVLGAQQDFVYRRNVRVGPVDDVFRDGVAKVDLGKCTGDFAGLTALYQAATGAGHDLAPAGPSPYDIRRRQYAGFSDGAMKVVMHVTGGWMATPQRTRGYPGASFEDAISALKGRDIKQVGIYIPLPQKKKHHNDSERFQEFDGRADLARVAAETGALADRPVTCSVKLKAKVSPGSPLVCVYPEDEVPSKNVPLMGKQMVDLLGALSDPRPMRLAILGGSSPLARVSPSATRRLDHLQPQQLSYSVTFSCTPEQLGTVQQVELGGLVGSDVVARTTATVRCGSLPVPPPLRIDPLPSIPLVVAPAAQAAAPPANPVLQPNPATNPASQAQPGSQHAAQGAAAVQEEEQPQLAYVYGNAAPAQAQVGEQYEMSALPERREPPVPAWALVNSLGVTACAALALAVQRQRSAQALALNRARRRGR